MVSENEPLTEASGFQTLLCSDDFGAWQTVVSSTLGHHHSRLQSGSHSFSARIGCAVVDEYPVLSIQGTGRLDLLREQCADAVLWLPQEGLMQETINGVEVLAEPGTALLFRPGDVMHGLSADLVRGVSILIPPHQLSQLQLASPLLREGLAQQQLISAAHDLVAAAAMGKPDASCAAERFADALAQDLRPPDLQDKRERVTATRRRSLVVEACIWMQERLAERFSVVELSEALDVSVRTVQNSFQTELGCSPMAELKRLRLRQLRTQLLDPELDSLSISALMNQAGLLACGVTAADYERWCGELPRRTRRRLWHRR